MECPKCSEPYGQRRTGPHPKGCTVQSRFWAKVQIGDGCWEWQGANMGRKGYHYGMFRTRVGARNRAVYAHRFSYELHYGPIPPGLQVCHRCDNARCVRPTHLFLGTAKDNVADMWAKGRANPVSWNARKTHCFRGHAFDAENTYITRAGERECRACRRKPNGRGPMPQMRGPRRRKS